MPHRKGLEDLILTKFRKDQTLYGVEIGCFKGELSKHLLNTFPNLYLTTIDPYLQWNHVLNNTINYQNRFQIMPFHSDVACNFLDKQFDFIFIDGDHSYEQCRRDIVNFLRYVKPNGIFSGHNYHKDENSAHPGVHLSVDEIFGDKVKLQPDFIWYV